MNYANCKILLRFLRITYSFSKACYKYSYDKYNLRKAVIDYQLVTQLRVLLN